MLAVLPMQLITLYPGLMPSNSQFMRAVPPLHDIADVTQLCRGDSIRVQQCKKFLLDYLRHITSSGISTDTQPMVLVIDINCFVWCVSWKSLTYIVHLSAQFHSVMLVFWY